MMVPFQLCESYENVDDAQPIEESKSTEHDSGESSSNLVMPVRN
jgi:hypothetical protein